MKKCTACGVAKTKAQFYRHPLMADGRLSRCKECTKDAVRKNRLKRIDYYRAFDAARNNLPHRVSARIKYANTARGRAASNAAKKKYSLKDAVRRAAHCLTGNAIRDGRLVRQPCEVCGATERIQAHHDDYAKPLEVRWLCVKHHNEYHRHERGNLLGGI